MAYRLEANESVEAGVARVAREQIDRALAEIASDPPGAHETVHQVRKRCKKLRGLLRLVRPALADPEVYARENAWFRDSARALSGLRDAEAMLECLDGLEKAADAADAGPLVDVRRAREARRDARGSEDVEGRLSAFAERMHAARAHLAHWSLSAQGFDAVAGGVRCTYRRGRRGLDAAHAEGSPEAFHEWRKRVKYGWYHVRLLREAWPPVMEARIAAAKELSDLLGDDHDLAVLRARLRKEPAAFGGASALEAVEALARARQDALRARARLVGRLLYAEKPKAWTRRLGMYWQAWREEAGAPERVASGR